MTSGVEAFHPLAFPFLVAADSWAVVVSGLFYAAFVAAVAASVGYSVVASAIFAAVISIAAAAHI